MITSEEKAIIVKRLGEKTGLPWRDDLGRREISISRHIEIILQYTIKPELAVVQGSLPEDDSVRFPVLIRVMPGMYNAKEVTKLRAKEILRDLVSCEALFGIAKFNLDLLTQNYEIADTGKIGSFAENVPVVGKYLRYLTSNGTSVGYDGRGNERVFCDPDWIIDSNSRTYEKYKDYYKKSICYTSAIFWYSTSISSIEECFI